jgi:hypothetical protein
VLAQIIEIQKPINAAQQVIRGNVSFEIEEVKQLVLHTRLLPHHIDVPSPLTYDSDKSIHWKFEEFFNKIGR